MRCCGRVMCLSLSWAGLALSMRRAPHSPSWDPAVGESCLSQSSCGGGQALRPRVRSSQGRRHLKASCGRNLTAQPFGPPPPDPVPSPASPSLPYPSASLSCSPVLRGCTPAPGPGLSRPSVQQRFGDRQMHSQPWWGRGWSCPRGSACCKRLRAAAPGCAGWWLQSPLSRQQGAPAVPASDLRPLALFGSQASSACSCRWQAGISPGLRSPSPAARSFALSAPLLFGPVSGRGKYSSRLWSQPGLCGFLYHVFRGASGAGGRQRALGWGRLAWKPSGVRLHGLPGGGQRRAVPPPVWSRILILAFSDCERRCVSRPGPCICGSRGDECAVFTAACPQREGWTEGGLWTVPCSTAVNKQWTSVTSACPLGMFLFLHVFMKTRERV